ncbi:hypothetical protein DFA_03438 [Cavenderia fasciculata]|uniref:inosine/xanthosine triphosphatase n=1 Tax=Cavenderia fasciculata TaxID=261658 RepID=F4PHK6_CACFS|nr:uncharacterized protein DFA_03438 [Cavenderia fasciculata]EGG25190.1 hypothetical protein DFA_03438 [Cavenderia fasciculata]|eukprot:XP_004363041.1 hypothetical protein DFA_03438 [Cavenderia fasciculata]
MIICIEKRMVIVAVGSTNKSKIRAVQIALEQVFPLEQTHQVLAVSVESSVSAQPMDDDEAIKGAEHRAKVALEKEPTALYGVGLEGGVHKIGDKWFECGWIVTVDRNGRTGISSTSRFEMPKLVMNEIIDNGKELAEVMDQITSKTDVRSNEGAMGIFTNGLLHRDHVYSHAVIFSFSKFVTSPSYWSLDN